MCKIMKTLLLKNDQAGALNNGRDRELYAFGFKVTLFLGVTCMKLKEVNPLNPLNLKNNKVCYSGNAKQY